MEVYFCNISWCLCPDTAFKVLSVEVYFSNIFWSVCSDAGLIYLLKYYYNLYKYNTMALAVELYFL